MSEDWYKERCPECDTINWFCDGDESDITGVDIEAIKCHKCGHIWSTEEMAGGEDDTSQNEREEKWNYDDGLKNPI